MSKIPDHNDQKNQDDDDDPKIYSYKRKGKGKKAAYTQPSRSFNGEIHHLDQHQAYFIT